MEPEEELPCACLDDPAPQRDDAAFAGDYDLYRKAYKAWHARRQLKDGQRKKKQCVAFPKPRGKPPLADGVACTWDTANGCWLTASGAQHDGACLSSMLLVA